MALTTQYFENWADGNGANRVFNYTFDGISASQVKLKVYHADGSTSVPLYTVDTINAVLTGTITISDSAPAPASTDKVQIYRDTAQIQEVPFSTLSGYNGRALENLLSDMVAMIQEVSYHTQNNVVQLTNPQQRISFNNFLEVDENKIPVFDYTAQSFKQSSFTEAQAQLVIDNAVRSTDLSVKNLSWDNINKFLRMTKVGTLGTDNINVPVSTNVRQVRARQLQDGSIIFEYTLNGQAWLSASAQNVPISSIEGLQEALDGKLNLVSPTTQYLSSNITLMPGFKILARNENNQDEELIGLGRYGTYEQTEVGSEQRPLCLNHNTKSFDGTEVGKNIIVNYKDDNGHNQADLVAYMTDLAAVSTEASELVAEETTRATSAEEALAQRVSAVEGIGGYLPMHDFGTATPTQQELTDYALAQIGITDPLQIFNSTRVENTFDGTTWILTNTPTTDPAVFEWIQGSNASVSIATTTTAGIVKAGTATGEVAVDSAEKMSVIGFDTKLDVSNLGKYVLSGDTLGYFLRVNPAADQCAINYSFKDIETGQTMNSSTFIPIASSTVAGLITPAEKALIASIKPSNFKTVVPAVALGAIMTIPFIGGARAIVMLDNEALPISASNITLVLPTTDETEAWDFQIRIKCGETIPTLTWTNTIKWVGASTGQIVDKNKTSIFVFEKIGDDIVGSYAESY